MGAHTPVPWAPPDVVEQVMEEAVRPLLAELRRRGIDYRGVLYAGMMLTAMGPKVVEFNVRFGDPEAQVVLPKVRRGLGDFLKAAAIGELTHAPTVDNLAYLGVSLTSPGYPESPILGKTVTGIADATAIEGITVYHSGTALVDGELRTAGGRVLTITAGAPTLAAARDAAYRACAMISFEGMQYRRDIGLRALSDK